MTQNDLTTSSTPTTSSRPHRSRVGATWLTLGAFVVILILLLIFILQNNNDVEIEYFGFKGSIPFGIAMIVAAIVGSVLTMLIGSIRIIQLKLAARKTTP